MTLGKHLGADQDAWLASIDFFEQVLHGGFAGGGVTIDTDNRGAWKLLLQCAFTALGSNATKIQLLTTTVRAVLGQLPLAFAVMAAQQVLFEVNGHRGIAMRALRSIAAVVAHQQWRKSAPVNKYQYLVTLVNFGVDCCEQGMAKTFVHRRVANIKQLEFRLSCASGALRQLQVLIAPLQGIVEAFQARGG